MIKHFGRWVTALMILLALAGWFIERTVAQDTITRALWVIYIASPVAALLLVERRRGARPGILTMVATLAAASAFAWILLGLDARWWIRALLITVLGTPAMAVANAMYRGDVLRAQRGRDRRATTLARAVVAGEKVERFALYLRPFVSTDRLMAQALPSDVASGEVPVHLDVETLLARTLRTTAPLIALGKSGDTVEGPARVTVADGVWRETVEALARQAVFIALVPLQRPGTMWELEWLKRNDLLDKTLLIMPESPHQAPSGVVVSEEADDRIFEAGVRQFEAATHMLDLPTEWADVERAVRSFGLTFPPLAGVGALFTLHPTSGVVRDIVPLGLTTMPRRVRHLRASIERLGLLPATRPPVDLIEGFSKAVFWGGRTLEFALVSGGDGYAVWGDASSAVRWLQRGVEAGQPRPAIASDYINALPDLIRQRVQAGDAGAAAHYRAFARRLRADPLLASLATPDTLGALAALETSLETSTR